MGNREVARVKQPQFSHPQIFPEIEHSEPLAILRIAGDRTQTPGQSRPVAQDWALLSSNVTGMQPTTSPGPGEVLNRCSWG